MRGLHRLPWRLLLRRRGCCCRIGGSSLGDEQGRPLQRLQQWQLLLLMPGLLHTDESRLLLLLPWLLHGAGMYLRPYASCPLKPRALDPLLMDPLKPRREDSGELVLLGLMMPGLQYPNRLLMLMVLLVQRKRATGGHCGFARTCSAWT